MKNKLAIVLSILLANLTTAQLNEVSLRTFDTLELFEGDYSDNTYFKDTHNDLSKYVGTWSYSHNNMQYHLVITLHTQVSVNYIKPNIFIDQLSVEYIVRDNGVIVKQSTPGILHRNQLWLAGIYSQNLQFNGNSIGNTSNYNKLKTFLYDEEFSDYTCRLPNHHELEINYINSINNIGNIATVGKLNWTLTDTGRNYTAGRNHTCANVYAMPNTMTLIKQP